MDLPVLTNKDIDDLVNFAVRHKFDFVAASFVQSGDDVRWVFGEGGGSMEAAGAGARRRGQQGMVHAHGRRRRQGCCPVQAGVTRVAVRCIALCSSVVSRYVPEL